MDDLEADPSSRQRQTRLAEDLSAKNAAADAELIALAQRLIDAIRETEAGRKSLGKYNIEALGAQVGVIGDGTRIEGGIHFHNYGGSGGGAARSNSSANGTDARQPDEPCSVRMNILHLSDLHFGTTEDAHRWHGQLADDLKQELHCDKLDAMIITGDVANFAVKEEYNAARIFIEWVCAEFKIPSASLAIVPGNHDLNWKLSKKGYILMDKEDMEASVGEGDYIPESESIIRLKDDEAYQKRFSPFSQFYLQITGVPYPLAHDQQGMIYHLKAHDLLILGLNSAWQVDHHYRARAAICPDAFGPTPVCQDPATGEPAHRQGGAKGHLRTAGRLRAGADTGGRISHGLTGCGKGSS